MVVLGAGGLAAQMLDTLLEHCPADALRFYVESGFAAPQQFYGCSTIQSAEALQLALQQDPRFILAVGHPATRRTYAERWMAFGGSPYTLISRHALVSAFARMEPGCSILPMALIEAGAILQQQVLVNAGAAIHHDCRIGAFTDIGPGARLLGGVVVGEAVTIGAAATILPRITIGDGATIGAGAVVTRPVAAGLTVYGVPARGSNETA